MSNKRIAKSITLDKDRGDIWIDGMQFPWHVAVDPWISGTKRDDITTVNIGIFCDSAHVIGKLADDLQWVREMAEREMKEALADFLGTQIGKRWEAGMFAYMDHTTLPNVRERFASPTTPTTEESA